MSSLSQKFQRLFLLLLLLVPGVDAANFQLEASRSSLTYEIVKFGSITVIGELSPAGRRTLSGNIQLADLDAGSDISGSISLLDPDFTTDSYQRDRALSALVKGGINISNLRIVRYDKSGGYLRTEFDLLLNGRSHAEYSEARLERSGGNIKLSGEIRVTRKRYGLVFTEGFEATFDSALADELYLKYQLFFITDENTLSQFTETSADKPLVEETSGVMQAFRNFVATYLPFLSN